MFETVLDAFAEATGCDRDALRAVVGLVPESAELTPEQLLDRIAAQEKAVHAMQAAQARDLAAFGAARHEQDVAEQVPDHLHGRTAGTEVGLALGVATTTGQCRILDATRAVEDHPDLLALVGTGSVSMAGLRQVMSATEVLEPAQRRPVAAQLAADATADGLTPGQLGRAAERRVLRIDPDAAAKRVAAARRRRNVRLGDPYDGTAGIFARLRAEEALAVFTALDRMARAMRQEGDPRSLDDLMADLFVEWLTGTRMTPLAESPEQPPVTWRSVDGWEPWTWSDPPPLVPDADPEPADPCWDRFSDADPPGGPAGDPAHPPNGPPATPLQWRLPMKVEVQVVLSAATLLGLDDQPAMLRGYGAIPPEVVHDLVDVADSTGARTTLRGLFCDPFDGRLIAMDSTARCFTGGLRKFALYRDQDCRLSGGRIVDVDHIVEHQDTGETAAANGQGLGKLPHGVKDHPGVRVAALPPAEHRDGLDALRAHAPDVEWVMPTGHRHTRRPPTRARPRQSTAGAPRQRGRAASRAPAPTGSLTSRRGYALAILRSGADR